MMILSFSKTTAALRARHKTVTRRKWTKKHADMFEKAIERDGGLVQAWSASPHRKGTRIGTVRVFSVKEERTCEIPDSDWFAEGFDFMRANGLDVEKDLSCVKLWRLWRQDKEGTAYTVRFEVVEIFGEAML